MTIFCLFPDIFNFFCWSFSIRKFLVKKLLVVVTQVVPRHCPVCCNVKYIHSFHSVDYLSATSCRFYVCSVCSIQMGKNKYYSGELGLWCRNPGFSTVESNPIIKVYILTPKATKQINYGFSSKRKSATILVKRRVNHNFPTTCCFMVKTLWFVCLVNRFKMVVINNRVNYCGNDVQQLLLLHSLVPLESCTVLMLQWPEIAKLLTEGIYKNK